MRRGSPCSVRRHRAAVAGAFEQAHEGMPLLRVADSRLAAEDGLDLVESLAGDERLVRTLIPL